MQNIEHGSSTLLLLEKLQLQSVLLFVNKLIKGSHEKIELLLINKSTNFLLNRE